jgi:homoserine O-succinyltransferase
MTEFAARATPIELDGAGSGCIDVGLVNNMPDAALEATERQFQSLLAAAARGIAVRLTIYSLPEVPRSDEGRRHLRRYRDIGELWDRRLDGLIVTGTEPRAPDLRDEPYWRSLTRLLEWADDRTHSAVCSCLAAHAAVLHMDGIRRQRLADKCFGVFECSRVSDHPLAAGAPPRLDMPHSRWNDLPAEELEACGYRMLTHSEAAGVDAFVKQWKSLFVYFQGHPEYEADTLLREYRRDVKRYLRRESESYPPMPHGYFDESTASALAAARERAQSDRREEVLGDLHAALRSASPANTWRPTGEAFYRNWLLHLCAQKRRGAGAG